MTARGCNCLPFYTYTEPASGLVLSVGNGSCIRTSNTSLPWCLVAEATCTGKPDHLPSGDALDTCLVPGSSPPVS